ncbi:MAG: sulfotransferase [Proteobacteria bacterium]|nr:sulfotransferase [Pseudomonadota bacterium]
MQQGDGHAAETSLRDWLLLGADDPRVLAMLARLRSLAGRSDEAVTFLERARALDSISLSLTLALVDARMASGDAGGAEELAIAVRNEHPGDVRPRLRLANLRMDIGNFAGAAEAARDALANTPGQPTALSILVECGEVEDSDELLKRIQHALTGEVGHTALARAVLHFAAGRLCQRMGRFDRAFEHYLAGNRTRRRDLKRNGFGHDRLAVTREMDRLIDVFDAAGFKADGGGSESETPVFIVGMARSGTSLAEQILASHPDITGAGEMQTIPRIVNGLRRAGGYPVQLPDVTVKAAARQYLEEIDRHGGGAARVVDKMPMNILHLGLIARLFPRARIIHCRRDPLDNCLSCFAENFRVQGLAWAYDLGDLGHMYCQYRRMAAHWLTVLPAGMMLELDYEEVVNDLEGQARRLIDFVDLEWDEACLEFHTNKRVVITPSRGQVRKPVYASSIGRWRHYDNRLGPLTDALAACGCGPELSRAK